MRRSGASPRLSKVYSKIQAWEWLSGEFEAALMLDTDLYIKHSLDEALYKVSHCKIAGAFRGRGDFPLNRPRHPSTIKTKKGLDRGRRGGGINGGFVVFRPDAQEYRQMLRGLSSYEAPDDAGGEQDYISQYFGLQGQIGQLDLADNYQIHQLSQTAVTDHEEGHRDRDRDRDSR